MRCSEFVEHYSDYRDNRIRNPALRAALVRHLERCARCQRYDTLVTRGARLLQASDVDPSPRFSRRLRRRLMRADLDQPILPSRGGMVAALMVLAAGALMVWEVWPTTPAPTAVAAPLLAPRAEPAAEPPEPRSIRASTRTAATAPREDFVVPAFGTAWRAPATVEAGLAGWPSAP